CRDQARKLLRWRARPKGDRLRGFEEVLDTAGADDLERNLLGPEIVVEAGLANLQHVRDGLRGGAVVAALGEDTRRRLDDLGGAAVGVAAAGAPFFWRCVPRPPPRAPAPLPDSGEP